MISEAERAPKLGEAVPFALVGCGSSVNARNPRPNGLRSRPFGGSMRYPLLYKHAEMASDAMPPHARFRRMGGGEMPLPSPST